MTCATVQLIISVPLSAIVGGGLETRIMVDAPLLGAVLGSTVVELTAAQLTIGAPFGVAQSATATVRVNCAEASTPNEGAVHNTSRCHQPAGVVQLQPGGAASDWKTVPNGIASTINRFAAGRSSLVGRVGRRISVLLFLTVML